MDDRHETLRARDAFLRAARQHRDGATGELAFGDYMCVSTPDTVLPMLSRFIMAGATEIGREFRDAALQDCTLSPLDEPPLLILAPASDSDVTESTRAAMQLGTAIANYDHGLAVDIVCARRSCGGVAGLVGLAVSLVSVYGEVHDMVTAEPNT